MKCEPCQSGVYFSSLLDTSSCKPCTKCREDQMIKRNCTPSLDTVCAKRCSSNTRYYDEEGGYLPRSKCCGNEQDVVKDECKEKLGAGSNMICSYYISLQRCDKSIHAATTQRPVSDGFTNSTQSVKSANTTPTGGQSWQLVVIGNASLSLILIICFALSLRLCRRQRFNKGMFCTACTCSRSLVPIVNSCQYVRVT